MSTQTVNYFELQYRYPYEREWRTARMGAIQLGDEQYVYGFPTFERAERAREDTQAFYRIMPVTITVERHEEEAKKFPRLCG